MATPDLDQLASRTLLALSPLGRAQRLSILIYHRVVTQRDWMRPGEPTAQEFDWQMRLLKRHFNILPLSDAVQKLKAGRLPSRAVCVTFDDGYADNATVALPVLQRYGIPATVFVAAGYLNGGRMWNDTIIESLRHHSADAMDLSAAGLPVYKTVTRALRRTAAHDIIRQSKYLDSQRREQLATQIAALADTLSNPLPSPLPDNLMLTTQQLLTLHRNGVEIGGHTYSHPILARLEPHQAQHEIVRGKQALEALIGEPLRVFAYPNGQPGKDYNQDHIKLVKEAGFEAAVATHWGVASKHSDAFQLPRFTPWDKSPIKFLLRMALNSRHSPPSGALPC